MTSSHALARAQDRLRTITLHVRSHLQSSGQCDLEWIEHGGARRRIVSEALVDLIEEPLIDGIEAVALVYGEIQDQRRRFDFEISFGNSPEPTTASELSHILEFFKTRGQPAQFIAPNLAQSAEGLSQLADIAQSFNAMLSVHARGDESPETIEQIVKACSGRVNYKISANLEPSDIVRLAERLKL